MLDKTPKIKESILIVNKHIIDKNNIITGRHFVFLRKNNENKIIADIANHKITIKSIIKGT